MSSAALYQCFTALELPFDFSSHRYRRTLNLAHRSRHPMNICGGTAKELTAPAPPVSSLPIDYVVGPMANLLAVSDPTTTLLGRTRQHRLTSNLRLHVMVSMFTLKKLFEECVRSGGNK